MRIEVSHQICKDIKQKGNKVNYYLKNRRRQEKLTILKEIFLPSFKPKLPTDIRNTYKYRTHIKYTKYNLR